LEGTKVLDFLDMKGKCYATRYETL
jgi:hypothetical protein